MSSLLLATSLLVFGARATYNDAASNVVSAASVLNNDLGGFKGADGIGGALNIQAHFPALSSAFGDYVNTINAASESDIDVQATSHVSNELIKLLENLTTKASDFSTVGANQIAANDLKDLANPATTAINGIIKFLGENESKWNDVSSGLQNLEVKLNSANKAYSVPEIQFAANPTFNGASKSAATSSSESSASSEKSASSSEKAASTEKSSATAAETSASGTAAAAKKASETGKDKKAPCNSTRSSKSSSAPKVNNGAPVFISGISAVGVAFAALLL